jgi:hypothetical protein
MRHNRRCNPKGLSSKQLGNTFLQFAISVSDFGGIKEMNEHQARLISFGKSIDYFICSMMYGIADVEYHSVVVFPNSASNAVFHPTIALFTRQLFTFAEPKSI